MKRRGIGIGIAAILVLVLVLFQRKEEVGVEKTAAAGKASIASIGKESGSFTAGGKPTKVRQRPEVAKKEDEVKMPVAKAVKGRPGFVYDPSSGEILNVRGLPAGSMATNGMGPAFIVPKMSYIITPKEAMDSLTRGGGVMSISCRPFYSEPRWDDGSPVMPGDLEGSGEGF